MLEAERDSLEQQNKELATNLAQAEVDGEKYLDVVKELNDQATEDQQTHAVELTDCRELATQAHTELESAYNCLKQHCQHLTVMMKDSTQQLAQEVAVVLTQAAKKYELLLSTNSDFHQESSAVLDRVATLEQEVVTLQDKRQQASAELSKCEQLRERASTEYTELVEEYAKVVHQNSEVKALQEQDTEKHDLLLAANNELKEQNTTLEASLLNLSADVVEKSRQIAHLQKQTQGTTDQHDLLQGKCNGLEQQKSSLEQNLKETAADLLNSATDLGASKKAREVSAVERASLQFKLKESEKCRSDAVREHSMLQQQMAQLQQDMGEELIMVQNDMESLKSKYLANSEQEAHQHELLVATVANTVQMAAAHLGAKPVQLSAGFVAEDSEYRSLLLEKGQLLAKLDKLTQASSALEVENRKLVISLEETTGELVDSEAKIRTLEQDGISKELELVSFKEHRFNQLEQEHLVLMAKWNVQTKSLADANDALTESEQRRQHAVEDKTMLQHKYAKMLQHYSLVDGEMGSLLKGSAELQAQCTLQQLETRQLQQESAHYRGQAQCLWALQQMTNLWRRSTMQASRHSLVAQWRQNRDSSRQQQALRSAQELRWRLLCAGALSQQQVRQAEAAQMQVAIEGADIQSQVSIAKDGLLCQVQQVEQQLQEIQVREAHLQSVCVQYKQTGAQYKLQCDQYKVQCDQSKLESVRYKQQCAQYKLLYEELQLKLAANHQVFS